MTMIMIAAIVRLYNMTQMKLGYGITFNMEKH